MANSPDMEERIRSDLSIIQQNAPLYPTEYIVSDPNTSLLDQNPFQLAFNQIVAEYGTSITKLISSKADKQPTWFAINYPSHINNGVMSVVDYLKIVLLEAVKGFRVSQTIPQEFSISLLRSQALLDLHDNTSAVNVYHTESRDDFKAFFDSFMYAISTCSRRHAALQTWPAYLKSFFLKRLPIPDHTALLKKTGVRGLARTREIPLLLSYPQWLILGNEIYNNQEASIDDHLAAPNVASFSEQNPALVTAWIKHIKSTLQ